MSAGRRATTLIALAVALAGCPAGTPPTPPTPSATKSPKTTLTATSPSPTASTSPAASTSPDTSTKRSPSPTTGIVASPSPTIAPSPTPTPVPTPPATLSFQVDEHVPGTWRAAPQLTRPRAGLVLGVAGDRLIACEGENAPSSERWKAGAWDLDTSYDVASVPIPSNAVNGGTHMAGGTSIGDRFFTIGGDDRPSLMGYNAAEFVAMQQILGGGLSGPAVASFKGRLFVAGGAILDLKQQPLIQKAPGWIDVDTGSTYSGPELPVPVAGAAYATLGGKLYLAGGYTIEGTGKTKPTAAVQIFDLATATWVRDGAANGPKPLPAAVDSAAAAFVDGLLYVVGGRDAAGKVTNLVRIYDPGKNTWTDGPKLPTARALLGVAAYEGRVWAVGGFDAKGRPLATAEVLRP